MSERVGILLVSTDLLERMFCFPTGCKIVGASFVESKGEYKMLCITVASDALPETPDGHELPKVDLHVTVEEHPVDRSYRRITTKLSMS